MNKYLLYINGKWIEPETGETTAVENPSNEEIIGYVSNAGEKEVDMALQAAADAQSSWGKLPIVERVKYVKKLVKLTQEKKEYLAKLLTLEQGKPYIEALGEVDDTILYLENAIENANRIKGDFIPGAVANEKVIIDKVPYGVVVALCAWNYPLALVTRKIGPALVTGNTVVLKPHELTPLTTAEYFKLIDLAGFPKGVINLITGSGAETGSKLVQDPRTRLVTVTGSVRAGQAIYKSASQNIAGLIMELGGKAPFIVLEDADIDKAVESAVVSRYTNCGQICVCCDMIFVQESVAEEFTKKLLERVKKIKVGDPFDSNTDMGAKTSKSDLEKIDSIVKRTVAAGAKLACGGKRLSGQGFEKGYWYEPTVLTDVTMDMAAAQDEIFGPVLPILKIKNYEQAVEMANSSSYGLACYLYTKDYSIINRSSGDLEVGTIFINRAVGGNMNVYHNGHKLSGLGGEDGEYGIEDFLQKRVAYLSY